MLDHISLTVKDVEASARFYMGLFGLKTDKGWERKPEGLRAMVLLSDNTTRLELIQAKDMKPNLNNRNRNNFVDVTKQEGFTHISFSVKNMDGTVAKAVEMGGRIIEKPRTGITVKSFAFVEDPDGIAIELVERDRSK
jgi:catechol 2,3-dioxygenase-like lactoylglutathione lyase family enzyme